LPADPAVAGASFCSLQKEDWSGRSRSDRSGRTSQEAEKAALLAEVDAEGGKVASVARRHGISESLLYNWRAAVRAAAATKPTAEPVEFVPIGVFSRADDEGPALLAAPAMSAREELKRPRLPDPSMDTRPGLIEVDLPSGARIRVDALVNEKALSRVLRAMKGSV
jgi:transposase